MNFFSGGGFPFGGFSQDDDDDGPVDTQKYYKVLGLKKQSTQQEVKKAFIELSKKHHPDKAGGNTDKFKEISEAYQVLNDPEKRKIYDKYGEKGLERGGSDQSDLLNMFFGGGGMGRQQQKRVPKVKPTKKVLDVTLESVFNGDVIKVPVKRCRCCETCKGKGGSEVKNCTDCKGRGSVVKMVQLGPGMYQQMQANCAACKGEGKIIEEKHKCKTCKGEATLQKEKVIDVPVEKGVPHGYAITIPGEGDELPDCLSGDLIFVVNIKKHDLFTRVGADLFFKKKISLIDALTGVNFTIKHLDGTNVKIETIKGDVISDKEKKVVRGLGCHFFQNQMSQGNLIIEFEVEMPKAGLIKPEVFQKLAKALPGKLNERPKDSNYELLEEFQPADMHTSAEGGYKKEEQEEEEQTHGKRVECNSQ